MQKNTLILLLMFLIGVINAKTVNADQEPPPHDTFVVEYKYGLISIHTQGTSLERILRDICDKANIQIILHGDFSAKVNLSVTSLSLENVIRRLINDRNFVIVYASNNNENYQPIEKIYLYKGTQASRIKVELMPSEVLKELDLVTQLATFPDDEAIPALAKKLTEKKSQAVFQFVIENLVDIGGDLAANALAKGLVDDRGQMRTDIVLALGQLDSEQASLILAQVIFGDSDPQTRIAAVDQLGNFTAESTKAFLDAASRDKDERVQLEAQYAMETWKFGRTPPF